MNPNPQPETPPQKLADFNEELKALCEKYQYELRPVMTLLPMGQGIITELKVFEVSPKQNGVKLTPEAPKEEVPQTGVAPLDSVPTE